MIRSRWTRSLAAALAGCLVFASCDRKPAAPPAKQPSAAAAAPAGPGLAELDAVYRLLPQDKIILAAYMKPGTAGLVLVDPPEADSREKFAAWLESFQPQIPRLLELSRRSLEPFPAVDPEPEAGAMVSSAPRFQLKWIGTILEADAARLVDKGEIDAALVRAAATLRLCGELRRQGHIVESAGRTAVISKRLTAIADATPDAWASVRTETANDLRDAFSRVGADAPGEIAARWEPESRKSLKFCRDAFSGQEAPAVYAQYLRQNAVSGETAASMDDLAAKPGWPKLSECMPHEERADAAAKLTPAEIAKALDDAEKLIPAIADALRAEDQPAIVAVMKIVAADPTHIARVVLGDAGTVVPFALTMREAISPAKAKLDLLPR